MTHVAEVLLSGRKLLDIHSAKHLFSVGCRDGRKHNSCVAMLPLRQCKPSNFSITTQSPYASMCQSVSTYIDRRRELLVCGELKRVNDTQKLREAPARGRGVCESQLDRVIRAEDKHLHMLV